MTTLFPVDTTLLGDGGAAPQATMTSTQKSGSVPVPEVFKVEVEEVTHHPPFWKTQYFKPPTVSHAVR